MRYANGSSVRVSGTFRNTDTQALQDPDVVKLDLTTPAGVLTTYTYPTGITKAGTGQYYATVDANADGNWTYRWYSTGTGQAAEESIFYIY
jgi:uncharacterized protein YfaS (alpha-2-macroglobulin family)